jgi:hypothetical protein
MNMKSILDYLEATYHVDIIEDSGNFFIFYDPDNQLPADYRFPYLTLVNNDLYDKASELSRPDIYRLNIGLGKTTFQSLFPDFSKRQEEEQLYDYTVLNQLLPHPVYGKMYWCCILNPDENTFIKMVRPLLEEAYQLALKFYTKRNN